MRRPPVDGSAQFRVPRFTSNITLRRHSGQISHSRFRAYPRPKRPAADLARRHRRAVARTDERFAARKALRGCPRSSSGSYRADASVTRRGRTTLPNCAGSASRSNARASLLERKHAVDHRQQPPGAQLADDRVELGVVPHRRSHDRPLIPEQSAHVGLDDRAGRRTARHEAARAGRARRATALHDRLADVVDHDVHAALRRARRGSLARRRGVRG